MQPLTCKIHDQNVPQYCFRIMDKKQGRDVTINIITLDAPFPILKN